MSWLNIAIIIAIALFIFVAGVRFGVYLEFNDKLQNERQHQAWRKRMGFKE